MIRTRSQSTGNVPRIYIHQFRRGEYDVNTIQYTRGSNMKPKDPLNGFTSDQFLPAEDKNAAKKMKRRKKRLAASSKLTVSAFDKPKSGRKFAEAFDIASRSDLMTKVPNVSCSQSWSKRAYPDLNGESHYEGNSNVKNKTAGQEGTEENHIYLKRNKLMEKRAEKGENMKNARKIASKNISGGDIPPQEMLRVIQRRKAPKNIGPGEKTKNISSIDEVIEEVIANFNTDVNIKDECSDAKCMRKGSLRGVYSMPTKSRKKQKIRNNRSKKGRDEKFNTGNAAIVAKEQDIIKSSEPLICRTKRLPSKESLNHENQNVTKSKRPKKKSKKEIVIEAARNEDLHSERLPRKDFKKQTFQENVPRVQFVNENMQQNKNISDVANMHRISTKRIRQGRFGKGTSEKTSTSLRQEVQKKSSKNIITKK